MAWSIETFILLLREPIYRPTHTLQTLTKKALGPTADLHFAFDNSNANYHKWNCGGLIGYIGQAYRPYDFGEFKDPPTPDPCRQPGAALFSNPDFHRAWDEHTAWCYADGHGDPVIAEQLAFRLCCELIDHNVVLVWRRESYDHRCSKGRFFVPGSQDSLNVLLRPPQPLA